MNTQTANRLERLRSRMVSTGTQLVVVGPGAHMQWLLGFHPHPDERPCLFLVGLESQAMLMPVLNAAECEQKTDVPFHTWSDADGPVAALAAAIADVNAEKATLVGLDETMRADFAFHVLDAIPDAKRTYLTDTVGALRMCKDENEFRLLKCAALVNDEVMKTAFAALKPGVTEREIADVVKGAFTEHGCTTEFIIVGSGPHGAFPHHGYSDRELQTGDALVLDIGGRRDGFPSDMTRMAVIGDGPEDYSKVHDIVERALLAGLAAAKVGGLSGDVDKAARQIIEAEGYGEYFTSRTGHGLGIEIHEPPYMVANSTTVLEEGMVFSIEPGIYMPGRFGVRLEEIVILRADGPEIFSELDRGVFVA